jgi:hypothetical protein
MMFIPEQFQALTITFVHLSDTSSKIGLTSNLSDGTSDKIPCEKNHCWQICRDVSLITEMGGFFMSFSCPGNV